MKKKQKNTRWIYVVIGAFVLLVVGGGIFFTLTQEKKPVRIMWFTNPSLEYVEKLSKQFTEETSIPVEVISVPIADWAKDGYEQMAAESPRYDLLVGDSQWLGYGAENGYYADLTDFFHTNKIEGTFSEASTKGYGEYPPDSGKYYAVPFVGNAKVYAYRKDWFENPLEKAAFQAKYGRELIPPKTLTELKDIAEFFYRPAEGKYGIVLITGEGYDAVTMEFGTFLFAFGGEWGDRAACIAEGYVNSDDAVQALTFMYDMTKFSPPGSDNLIYAEVGKKYFEGNTAIMMNYMSHVINAADPARNPYAEATGYFGALFGPKSKYSQLAGQGISLLAHAQDKKSARKFLSWWIREDVQKQFAEMGGFTTHRKVLASPSFQESKPYNAPYSESVELMKDFWNNPVYADLLAVSQKEIHTYLTGGNREAAKQTLDSIAKAWTGILAKGCSTD